MNMIDIANFTKGKTMGLLDTFRGQQYKNELETLQEKYDNLEKMLTPEMRDVIKLQELIAELEKQKRDIQSELDALNEKHQQIVSEHQTVLDELNSQIRSKKEEIISFDETILAQEFGLYSPRYDFINSEEYKENLDRIRNHQKQYIKPKIPKSIIHMLAHIQFKEFHDFFLKRCHCCINLLALPFNSNHPQGFHFIYDFLHIMAFKPSRLVHDVFDL